jgi:hypothetical protein
MRVEAYRGVMKEAVPRESSLARNAIGRTGIRLYGGSVVAYAVRPEQENDG